MFGLAKSIQGIAVTIPKTIQLDPRDNVLVALADLPSGERVVHSGETYTLQTAIPATSAFRGK